MDGDFVGRTSAKRTLLRKASGVTLSQSAPKEGSRMERGRDGTQTRGLRRFAPVEKVKLRHLLRAPCPFRCQQIFTPRTSNAGARRFAPLGFGFRPMEKVNPPPTPLVCTENFGACEFSRQGLQTPGRRGKVCWVTQDLGVGFYRKRGGMTTIALTARPTCPAAFPLPIDRKSFTTRYIRGSTIMLLHLSLHFLL
jgi:hypothetical protein